MIQLIALGSTGLKARIYIYRQVRLVTGDKAQEWRQQTSSLSKRGDWLGAELRKPSERTTPQGACRPASTGG